QAVARGERVLLLAPSASALDRALERLGPHATACSIRCLAAGEVADTLPPGIRRLTLAERLRFFEEHTLPAARESAQIAQLRAEGCTREEHLWPQLEEILRQWTPLEEQRRHVEQKRQTVAAEAAADFSPTLSSRLSELLVEAEKLRN